MGHRARPLLNFKFRAIGEDASLLASAGVYCAREGEAIMRNLMRSVAALGVLSILAGCSSTSLLNPYVGGDIRSPLEAAQTRPAPARAAAVAGEGAGPPAEGAEPAEESAPLYYGLLPDQIARASALQTAYYDAVGHQALLRNGLALTLIPLTAGALFHDSTHPGSDFAAGVAMVTSAGLGVGGFMQSPPRQRVYLSGVNAVACAVLKSQPYLITSEGHEQLVLRQSDLLTALAAVQTLVDRAPTTRALAREVSAAREALTRGQLAASDFSEVMAQIEGAPMALHTDLTFIRVSVAQQVTRTEPDLEALAGVLNRLRTTPAPSGAAEPPATPTETEDAQAPRVDAGVLAAATANLNAAVLVARSVVDGRRRMRAEAAASPACATGIASGSTFSVQPGEASATLVRGVPVDFVVSGSMLTANVTYSLAGPSTSDLEVAVTRNQGSVTFRVTAKAGASAGTRLLTISDRNGEDTFTTSLIVPES